MNEEFVKAIAETLEKESDIIALFLFGSQAKEGGKRGSDYDFFAVLDRNAKDTLREDEITRKA
ncbi:MAG: nucleotidyltransferase domain-containing protein, partial [Nanoarchaeota archaeon]